MFLPDSRCLFHPQTNHRVYKSVIKIAFRPLRHSASPTLLFTYVHNIRATLNKPSHMHWVTCSSHLPHSYPLPSLIFLSLTSQPNSWEPDIVVGNEPHLMTIGILPVLGIWIKYMSLLGLELSCIE